MEKAGSIPFGIIPFVIYVSLTALNMFLSNVLLIYVSLAIPLGLMVRKAKEDKQMRYWLIFGAVIGALYPIGEYFFAPPDWGEYNLEDIYILASPLHMCIVAVLGASLAGYSGETMGSLMTFLIVSPFIFVLEGFNAQAGFWTFYPHLRLWHVPLFILLSEILTLTLTKKFKVRFGPIIFSGFAGLMWRLFRFFIP